MQSQLFARVACNYVKLIISGSENVHRETFFKRFPSLVCQAVYTVFCRAFPTSYRQFDDRFKQDLADVTYQWIAGNWMFLFVFMIPFCDVWIHDIVHSQKRASQLLQACCLAFIKPISGCVCIVCSGLMITSLLQVVNSLDGYKWIVKTFYPRT